ncbi:ABC transporter ATP-binding protein [Pseudobacteriovorax antillogorgiicola]|uniref:Peptide/nickel transport system ATP-binding protein/oligopeptide transport system ATP-binding protein n=1 Tax=Pseudobacteriovorax antillogorgiicola TaxID=1513793 RepID=A0A1Y6BVQ1_9BACT|nr:dipeptide ABC transporter ATP-binding protein [Pseudobacteriovorax antillogorgiicola]TCS52310.1 peptide/nickel transport system ATP-binding protein/oligopeptide transport system ATP-binding protein [Pseudobacteriovorax antillogorgiicola]SMF30232.1 peptide/nickel transport system ATP-binding protein/oligopeptide transport system ATP-binding protein [Pseudobacteriovorax antillogorgiicola]
MTLLEVKDLKKHFPIHGGIFYQQVATVHAVDGVSFDVKPGEVLGLVGESGCGKSTVGRTILNLHQATSGEVRFGGKDLGSLSHREMLGVRRNLQMIFQDPFESLNPRHSIGQILEEPFIIHRNLDEAGRKARVVELLERVGLPGSYTHRYPHEFSGGQRQRIGIARAISQHPKLIVCDEPVSALDVSIQSQVVNLLLELQKELNLAYVFIAHDLAVVKHISDRVAVMYLGKIVELTDAERIYKQPLHPYTQALISAIPIPDPKVKRERIKLKGDVPSPINPPSGCRFRTRCYMAEERCAKEEPALRFMGSGDSGHQVACHFAEKFLST